MRCWERSERDGQAFKEAVARVAAAPPPHHTLSSPARPGCGLSFAHASIITYPYTQVLRSQAPMQQCALSIRAYCFWTV